MLSHHRLLLAACLITSACSGSQVASTGESYSSTASSTSGLSTSGSSSLSGASSSGGPATSTPTTSAGSATGETSFGSTSGTTSDGSATTTGDIDTTGDTGGDESPPCDYFSSPEGGLPGADGTKAKPWAPLAQLADDQAIPTEGVLCLLDGPHGAPIIEALDAGGALQIRAVNRHKATLSSLAFVDASGFEVLGIKIDAVGAIDPSEDQRQQFLVTGDQASHELVLSDVWVESGPSSAQWDQDDWVKLVRSGIDFRGPAIVIRDSTLLNTYHALLLRGDHSIAEHNLIDNFGGDGIRGLGSGSRYSWNVVRDAYIDEYEYQHDDAFQAYELEGDPRIADVTIDHNQFILFADPITDFVLENELVGTLMQGIIITDGYADGWVVENNLVVNGQAHGISLFGARNCRVQNNTVVAHPQFVPESGPWIRIADQSKTGHKNFDNVIRNNIAQMLTPWDYDASSIVEANIEAPWPAGFFVDGALDFRLGAASPAIDAGVNEALTAVDLDGEARVSGAFVDLGAYERQ